MLFSLNVKLKMVHSNFQLGFIFKNYGLLMTNEFFYKNVKVKSSKSHVYLAGSHIFLPIKGTHNKAEGLFLDHIRWRAIITLFFTTRFSI